MLRQFHTMTNDAEPSAAKVKPRPQIDHRPAIDEIEDLLTGEVSPKRAATLVQHYGVNFELTERIKARLLKLDADATLSLNHGLPQCPSSAPRPKDSNLRIGSYRIANESAGAL
jgi:hypothetical protein